jgi:hypothetical protein
MQLYLTDQRSSEDIGNQFGVSDATILAWLHRLGIPIRTRAERPHQGGRHPHKPQHYEK